MAEEFPDIVPYVKKYKEKHGYKKPAQKMQTAESQIIIDDVCFHSAQKHFLFTQVYDSIMCLEEDAAAIQKIMDDAFSKLGLSVTIKIER